jgi:23S rRNA (pseudouridine1915-N3)-methyltransferase
MPGRAERGKKMKITIACVGKIKEKYLTAGIGEYVKRLRRYCTLQICEVADEKTPDGASEAVEKAIKEKEGERLLKVIPEGAFVIALAIDGEMPDSVELSKKIESLTVRGVSHIVFVIGGSLGLSDAVLAGADRKISFSRMTFPHQLMRMILLEQIYRSFRILHHEPYHK